MKVAEVSPFLSVISFHENRLNSVIKVENGRWIKIDGPTNAVYNQLI